MQDPRLTPTAYIVLGLLSWVAEATPYELKRLVAEGVGHVWTVHHAQIYTEPSRLAGEGLLSVRVEPGGRRRQRYSITERGRRALAEWLGSPSEGLTEIRDPAFLQLYFGADPAPLAAVQLAVHRRRLHDFELELEGSEAVMPPGAALTLRAGIGHEREFIRFWERFQGRGGEADDLLRYNRIQGAGGAVTAVAPPPLDYATAVDRYLAAAALTTASRRVYRVSLTTCAWLLAGDRPPASRRGRVPPVVHLAVLDDPNLPARLAAGFAERAATTGPATVNREGAILHGAVRWWRAQGWIAADPSADLPRHVTVRSRRRDLAPAEVAAVLRLDVDLRERTLWRLVQETGAPAEDLLSLDVGDVDLATGSARPHVGRGVAEPIRWGPRAGRLLRRLLRGRIAGPLFLTERAAHSRAAPDDLCPVTGRGRLSHRRAAEIFTAATRALDPQGAGWTLEQLRRSALVGRRSAADGGEPLADRVSSVHRR